MKTTFSPRGICPRSIEIEVEDGVVTEVTFTGGCSGNLQAVSRLVQGLRADEAVEKLRGIDCNGKGTSCPDQLAKALESIAESASN